MSDAAPAVSKPDPNFELAKVRTTLALERTLLAWIRTGLTLIGFGFTLSKFMHDMIQTGHFQTTMLYPREVGIAMMTLGITGLTGGLLDYRRRMKRVHEGVETEVWTAAFIVSVVLVALSVYVMISLIVGMYFPRV
jgi:putative membrane protein